ncbi:MAG: flavodoxin-dependent (E)-4-hydroxy-3-methylbut-2-enyl-diphosphate synthase [Spirochaetes bacterium]|nr:flavodoxin-dependent (E)-4-hydroxy-3-methylbut-2-enyl-diphosphate synthase [Spirochaetota bacterium]
MKRNKTRQIRVKDLLIGGDAPISVQSMTNLPVRDVRGNVEQINRLDRAGCKLVRVALRTSDDVKFLKEILADVSIPVCADIHFDYRIALGAIEAGIHKIRINPGNIGSIEKTSIVAGAAREKNIPIRIGVNGGSIDRKKYSDATPEALVDSALSHVEILENLDFHDIAVSIKSSDIFSTIEANKLFASKRDYPVHVGLTEAGFGRTCLVQSSIAIGHLLLNGIGDTIRVSMTGDPYQEIDAAYDILRSLDIIEYGIKIISCPTCGRTDTGINLLEIAEEIENTMKAKFDSILERKNRIISIAVMGCEVNGPGEASHADYGIAGAGSSNFLLFKKGKSEGKIKCNEIISRLTGLIENDLYHTDI